MNELIPLISFPKSGNTWMRFLLANVFKKDIDEEINFSNINDFTLTSAFENMELCSKKIIEGAPIFIKEHANFYNMESYEYNKAIYIYRNGFDVLESYWHFTDAQSPGLYKDINQFSKCYWSYCGHWGEHLYSWMFESQKNIQVLSIDYDQLKNNTRKVMEEVLSFLGYNDIESDRINNAIENSDSKKMKKLPGGQEFMKSKKENFHFVRKAMKDGAKDNLPSDCKHIFLKNKMNFEMMKHFNFISSKDLNQYKGEKIRNNIIDQYYCKLLFWKYRFKNLFE